MRRLTLAVKSEYFQQIKSGEKKYEYRVYNAYWKKRILAKKFDFIEITLGYPKKTDSSKRIVRKWMGYHTRKITHKEFGDKPVEVFAIRVN